MTFELVVPDEAKWIVVIDSGLGSWVRGAPWWPFLLVLLAYYVTERPSWRCLPPPNAPGAPSTTGARCHSCAAWPKEPRRSWSTGLWLLLPAIAWQIALVWAAGRGVELRAEDRGRYRALS